MKSDFDAVLDHCLADLARGESLDTCLARHPGHAARLRPLLELAGDLASDLGGVSTPAALPDARAAGRQRMLAALAARSRQRSGLALLWHRPTAAGRTFGLRPAVLVVLVMLAAASAFVLATSATALPGDRLYPVKLARQEIQLALTFDRAEERVLAGQFATERRLDVGAALARGKSAHVHFDGVLEAIDGSRWMVSGLPVVVSDVTRIQGQPYLGAPVDVRGQLSTAGYVSALSIKVDPDHAPWPAPTRTRTPTPTSTATRAPSAAPPTVTDTATMAPSDTPTARPTITRPVTHTPRPTAVPSVTASATPTRTPMPSATTVPAGPSPSASPSPPLATAEPGPTGEPAETAQTPEPPRPTSTPRPSGTPGPTGVPSPSATPRPSTTPHPSETPEPTDTPKPTATPEPTDTPKPGDDDDKGRGRGDTQARVGRYSQSAVLFRCSGTGFSTGDQGGKQWTRMD